MPIDLRIVEMPVNEETMRAYQDISIAFTVSSRLRVELLDDGIAGFSLTEEPVDPTWVKDYDDDDGPMSWFKWWDLSNWRFFSALDGDQPIGGAVVALNTPNLWFLRRRSDLAALWNIRIDPQYRGRGVGRVLFNTAADFARSKGCSQLKIETSDVNVVACRFYAAMGAKLGGIDRFAYPNFPDEVELDWFLAL
jgi:GNAT superfamily N-acetyltransferase